MTGPERWQSHEHDVETASRERLGESALRGVRWLSIGRGLAEAAAFASSVVLARLIPPAEFGRATLAGILGAMFAAAVFRAVGAPLIRRDDLTRRHVETGFLLSVAIGAGMTAAAFLVATFAFGPLFGDDVVGLGQLASAMFLAGGAAAVPRALLLRRLDVKRTTGVDMAALSVGVVTSVGLALAGLDADALVVGGLAGATVGAILMIAVAHVPFPRWHRGIAAALGAYGGPASLASMLNAAAKNADYAILGARLDPTQVGLYWRAHRLGVDYQARLTGVMMELGLPVYSRASDREDMKRLRFRITRMHATAVLPLLALFIPIAPVLVPWLFGDAWESAVAPAQILAVGGMAAAVGSGTGSFVLAAGRPWVMVRFNLALLVLFSATVFFTAPHGLNAVCWGVVGARCLLLIGDYHLLLRPLIGVPIRRLWAEVVPGAVASAIMLAAVWPLTELMRTADVPPLALLTAAAAMGATLYLLVLRLLFPATLFDLAAVVRRLVRRGSRPEVAPAPAVR